MADNNEQNKNRNKEEINQAVDSAQNASGSSQDRGKKIKAKVLFDTDEHSAKHSATSKRKKREIIKSDEKPVSIAKRLTDFLVPILALFIFALLVIFVYVPFGKEIVDVRKDTKEVSEDVEFCENKSQELSDIDISDIDAKLATATSVVRDDMEVAELAKNVERMAKQHGLRSTSVELSDIDASLDEEDDTGKATRNVPNYADSISGPFAFYGEFSQITGFLETLRNDSPTILALDTISLSKYRSSEDQETDDDLEGKWRLEFVISGYTTDPADSAELYDTINTEVDEEILFEFQDRAEGLRSSEVDNEESSDENELETDQDSDSDENSDDSSTDN